MLRVIISSSPGVWEALGPDTALGDGRRSRQSRVLGRWEMAESRRAKGHAADTCVPATSETCQLPLRSPGTRARAVWEAAAPARPACPDGPQAPVHSHRRSFPGVWARLTGLQRGGLRGRSFLDNQEQGHRPPTYASLRPDPSGLSSCPPPPPPCPFFLF